MIANSCVARGPIARSDRSVAEFIPFSVQLDARTIRIRSGDYLRSWHLKGIPFETAEPHDILSHHEGWNQLVRTVGDSSAAIWYHHWRHRIPAHCARSGITDPVGAHLADQYADYLGRQVTYRNELFLTVVIRSPAFRRHLWRRRSEDLRERESAEKLAMRRFDELTLQIEVALAPYGPQALMARTVGRTCYSELLELFGLILNGRRERVPLASSPIHATLATSYLNFGAERLELGGPERSRFAALLDIKDFPDWTEPGSLDGLHYLDCEFLETQSFSPLPSQDARSFLQRQQNQLRSANDSATSQIQAINLALDQLANGAFVLGEHHYSLALLADSLAEVDDAVATARVALLDQGFQSAPVGLALDAAWFAQLPGNWWYRPRIARLSSRNFCGLAPLHGFYAGKHSGNPWGQSVAVLRTPHLGHFHFNFHASPEGVDAEGATAPGNTMIIGQTGSGKTVLELFLLAQSLKFGPRIVVLDKDRGAEIAIRALGGRYRVLRNGEATGLNPFDSDPTPLATRFWEELIVKVVELGGMTTDSEEKSAIAHAVQTVATFPRDRRSIATILQNLVAANFPRLAAALGRWSPNGPLGWVFNTDPEVDSYSNAELIGFDYSELFECAEVRTIVVMLLLHLVERSLDGRRFIYVLAEFWKALDDPVFTEFVRNKQKTIRKQNGLGLFDTQSPTDVLASPIARTLIEQTATFVFLANPNADRDDYISGFKLTPSEFEIVRRLGPGSRTFLIKQGPRSVVAQLDLAPVRGAISILSATTESLAAMESCISKLGPSPAAWLSEFLDIRVRPAPADAGPKGGRG